MQWVNSLLTLLFVEIFMTFKLRSQLELKLAMDMVLITIPFLWCLGFDSSDIANILKECLKMKAFVHPHVMGILGICLDGQAPYIVMPYMANGSLHSYLRKHRAELLIYEEEEIDLVQTISQWLHHKILLHVRGVSNKWESCTVSYCW